MDARTFESAIAFLYSRARPSRPQTKLDFGLSARSPDTAPLRGKPALLGMKQWLEQLGHSGSDLDGLNVIYVAGTKGKGSTCAYIESLLRAHSGGKFFPRKTGFYSSPHLLQMNERIRINFEPLPQARFVQYVFEVRDRLFLEDMNDGPRLLQLLALVSFYAFLRKGVEVAIYETHHGGEYDSTNIVEHPVITAITSIGMDHIIDLGPTIENIAWHKGGIMKAGATAFSAPQVPQVSIVLENRATEAKTNLKVVLPDADLPGTFASDVQRLNCSIARAVADEFLRRKAPKGQPECLSDRALTKGIRQFSWPGRFQIIQNHPITWCLDGAHNELSISEAARWFEGVSGKSVGSIPQRIVVFAQNSTNRNGEGVVKRLAESFKTPLELIIFTTNHQESGQCSIEEQTVLERYREIWMNSPALRTNVSTKASVSEAIELVREKTRGETYVLITGSLYLVGTTLKLGLHP